MMGCRDQSNTVLLKPNGSWNHEEGVTQGKLYCRGTQLPPEPVQKEGKEEDKIPEPLILALCSLSFQCLPLGRNKPARETGWCHLWQSNLQDTRQDREGWHLRGQKENNQHKWPFLPFIASWFYFAFPPFLKCQVAPSRRAATLSESPWLWAERPVCTSDSSFCGLSQPLWPGFP